MADKKERVTLSFRDEDIGLLDELNHLVEEGVYESRSHAIRDALKRKYSLEDYSTDERLLYDAAHSSYIEAHQKGLKDIKENAREHIVDRYGNSRMLEKLDEILN